jgi:1-acylglycerone phosphate reductase
VERLFAVNTLGPIRMVRAFHRLLVNAQGVVFNTGSTAAMFPSVYQAAYCASKAALHQYANVLRLEMEPLG